MFDVVDRVGEVNVVLVLPEYLDASNSRDFKAAFVALGGNVLHVILDLSNVQFVDSSSCGAILAWVRQVRARGGELRLCAVTRPVRALFELVRMHRVLDIYNTRDEALEAFATSLETP